MNTVSNIAVLLLLTFVVESMEEQEFKTKEKGATKHAEKILPHESSEDVCTGCKSLIGKMKEKMGKETSKEKILKQLDEFCSKDKKVEAACKKIKGDVKKQLCEAFSKGGDAETVCKKVKLCEKKHPHHL
ncbi:uncharacterized protein gnly [Halichoeres trimaculatus]|uniref:uncharacterized protein gnly n=1 Tax=Halichoeres trimaculatus TaxID=147232 RepID=UPI003D9EB225